MNDAITPIFVGTRLLISKLNGRHAVYSRQNVFKISLSLEEKPGEKPAIFREKKK